MTFRPAANDMVSSTAMAGVLVIGLAILFLTLFFTQREKGGVRYVFLGAFCFLCFLLVGSLSYRIRSYEVSSGNLVVNLGFSQKIFPLANLQDAHAISMPFAGARKNAANAGVWSYCGLFSSPALGSFRAYATERSQGVLLTWPDQKVFVTPEDAEKFIQSVKSAK